ncbi:MAG: Solvent efflux pump periplasmic linker SrpA [Ignavibacteria bacterium]|nr:Solvent efflux pump periplasmic linker SrpA [Ignavibacteria bacterium]
MKFLILFFIIFISGCGKEEEKPAPPPPEVKVFTVETKDIPVSNEWIGQTFGAEDIDIRARVNGYIDGIYFTEGTEVGKGTLLYTIDAKELQQEVLEAKGKLSEAQTLLIHAETEVNRFKPLAEAGAVSVQRYESALANYDAHKGNVEAALARLNLAEINLGYSRVEAPISGIIGITQFKIGDYVTKTPGSLLNTISNVDPIKARFSISEKEYLSFRKDAIQEISTTGRRSLNTKVEMILSDGTVYPFEGKVNIANRQVDPSTGTLMLEASFPNPDKLLRPGQYSKIRSVTKILTSALVIPSRAIGELQGQFQVFVVDSENKTSLRTIKKGQQFGQFTVIESGLNAGERIIAEGIQKIKSDMIIAPQNFEFPSDTNKSENK